MQTFSGTLTLVTEPLAVDEIVVTGTADFADTVSADGASGTALLIDAGGIGIFDTASAVTLGANVTIGNAAGSGTLGIETEDFWVGTSGTNADLLIATSSLAAGSEVEISGGLTVAGAILLGISAAARLDLSGTLIAEATTIEAAGTLSAAGNATAAFGGVVDAGTLALENDVAATASNLILTGALQLSGQSELTGLSSAVIGGAGSLTVGQGAAFSTSELNEVAGGIAVAGTLQVAGNLASAAAINLAGGTLSAAALTLSSTGLLSGFGDVALGSGTLNAAGDIAASGGLLVLDGDVAMSNGGSIAIAHGASLDLIGGASGNVVFGGANAELIVNHIPLDSASVSAMVGHDVIDLVGIAPSLVSYSGGIVSADGAGNALGHFSLSVASGQPAVEIVSDGNNGALITLGGEMACFARGTRLLTPGGYVPVEDFKPGDPIITQSGIKKPVRWIGRRVMEMGLRSRLDIRPVIVLPGAFGPGCPSREIRLSPSHAIFMEGVLVPAMHLVNGATIIRDRKPGAITYYHIELDRHAVVLADRLPVETYLDTGNRGQFHHETGARGDAKKACAKLVTNGPELARLRRLLHDIAIQAGFTTAQQPAFYGMLRDTKLLPEFLPRNRGLTARFTLPPDAGRIMLIAPAASPADTDPDSEDRRELGICLRQPRVKRDRMRLGAGWYQQAKGDAGIWMGGSGEVFLPSATTQLTLHLAAIVRSWQSPASR